MSVNSWDILLLIAAIVCLLVSAGVAFTWRQVAPGLLAVGLALWAAVPLIEYVRAA